eukprot:TRINITY_DN1151_c0_g1_i3.p2 TRINITY_DN1151_c0_g1~~TRINITY_DN1151_c0_g1_i3.p2  ORF type:complete len:187 (-),score=57.10 TRINITY_DN1151_c0_g1_i3:185-745(-)
MVSSFPYPPQFIHWMRQVFANPQPFIEACLNAMQKYKFNGFNIDWEPTTGAEDSDQQLYADFLTKFSDAIHAAGGKVTVDVGSWSKVWNWELLGKSSVDRVITMSTYTGNFTIWEKVFQQSLDQIPLAKIGTGLEMVNPNTNKNLSDQEIEERLMAIVKGGVMEIDIWRMPMGENWWGYLEKWIGQ